MNTTQEEQMLEDLYDMLNDEGWTRSDLCFGMVIMNSIIWPMATIDGLTFEPIEEYMV